MTLASVAFAVSGCADMAIIQEYQPRLGVPTSVAAASSEAGLGRPGLLPPAAGFLRGRVEEVFRADILSVKRLSDGRSFQVRLAGASVTAPVPVEGGDAGLAVPLQPLVAPAGELDRLGRARAVSEQLLGQIVIVEVVPVAPEGDAPSPDATLWGHIITKGWCLDAALIAKGLAFPLPGDYPRAGQMRLAHGLGSHLPQPGGAPSPPMRPPDRSPYPFPSMPNPIDDPLP